MTYFSRLFRIRATAHAAVSMALMAAVLGAVFALSGPDALASAIFQIKPSSIILIALLLTAGIGLSALRLKWIASSLGYRLSLHDAVMALTIGQIAGNLFFQFFGQLIGRSVVLAGRGIPPAASVVLFGYERIFALLVSLGLAACGAIYLFGSLHLDLQKGGISFLQVIAGVAVAVVAGAALGWGRQVYRLWLGITSTFSARLGWSGLLSLAVQLMTLSAYVVAGRTLAPDVDLLPLVAASCVIMFAASVPISFAGWGLREISAVVVLQSIGFSNAAALVTGLAIGIISLVVLATAALVFQFLVHPTEIAHEPPEATAAPDYTLALDWILPVVAATAVFFQIYVPTGSGDLSVNLADPVVLIGCALYVLRHLPRGWPELRVAGLRYHLIATTLVIVLAFLHGLAVFGFTNWGFTNRLLAWGILLCYAATGALIVERASAEGYEVLVKTFVATGVAVSLLNTTLMIIARLAGSVAAADQRLSGFSQNPNAFAFILLMAQAAALSLRQSERLRAVMVTCILIGIWHTGSRAGIGASIILMVVAVWWGVKLRPVVSAVLTTAGTVLTIKYLPELVGQLFNSSINIMLTMPWTERQYSDYEHLQTVWDGAKMFLSHPIFGAGLGAFMQEHLLETGIPLIIHSTPVWLMAETGIIGFAIFAAAAYRIFQTEFSRRHDPVARMILLMLVALAVMSSTHELLYQRSFWLLMGVSLAYPFIAPETAAKTPAAPPKD